MRTLLLIIDLQKGWRYKNTSETAMLKAVELCQHFGGDIVHCCFKNDPQSLFYSQLHWERFSESPDIDQIPEIAELDLPVYWRNTYSCLNEETLPLIRRYDQVFIAGVFTDISVAATAMAIFDLNIPVGVVTDCVATLHGQAIHEQALRSLDFALGSDRLVTVAQLLAATAT